jgi:hypothetical protein
MGTARRSYAARQLLDTVIGWMGRVLNPRGTFALTLAVAAVAVAGCGKDGGGPAPSAPATPAVGAAAGDEAAGSALGFPSFATKNTTRVGGSDAIADAAGVAQAVWPATGPTTRPPAVTLVQAGDWRAAIAAAVLVAPPVRAPLLLADGDQLPPAPKDALKRLQPTGSAVLGGAQVIKVGDVPATGNRTTAVAGKDPFELAAAIDRIATTAQGEPSKAVMVVGADAPTFAMPAAAYAAKSGTPVLFTAREELPAATAAAIRTHGRPRIYVLGNESAVSAKVVDQLGKLGATTRIGADTPQKSAIAFARYSDGGFGWGVTDPGHGLVFANPSQPATAGAAAPLSSAGSYGPLLLVEDDGSLPDEVVQYLLDIQPGYDADPVRGVYNHGWLIGDERLISLDAQSRIDALLEISPVNDESS